MRSLKPILFIALVCLATLFVVSRFMPRVKMLVLGGNTGA